MSEQDQITEDLTSDESTDKQTSEEQSTSSVSESNTPAQLTVSSASGSSVSLERGVSNEGELFEDALSDVQGVSTGRSSASEAIVDSLNHTASSDDKSQQSSDEIAADQETEYSPSPEPESEQRLQSAAAARAAKAREAAKGKDTSSPVAVLQTRGLQDEIQSIIDNLNKEYAKSSSELESKMNSMQKRIDELEKKISS